jgi:hypothetical protein
VITALPKSRRTECGAYGGFPISILTKTYAQRETLTIAGFALDGTKWDGLDLGRRRAGT